MAAAVWHRQPIGSLKCLPNVPPAQADFTPVCTTELGRVAHLIPEFERRNVKVVALSVDSVEDHKKWILVRIRIFRAGPLLACLPVRPVPVLLPASRAHAPASCRTSTSSTSAP